MAENDDLLVLAGEFPPATRDGWRKLVDGVLKGAPFERLVGRTADGLALEPLYVRATDAAGLALEPLYVRARDAAVVAGRAETRPWQIMQRVDHPDPAEANKQALID